MRLRYGLGLTDVRRNASEVISTLVDSLVAYWSLDEVSGTRYDSVGSADLTDNNTVGSDTGMHNAAASFVAANSESLSCASAGLPVGTHSYSISTWFNPTAVNAEFPILGKYHSAGESRDYLLDLVNNQVWFFAGDNSGVPRWTDPAIQAGVWHHVLAWYDSTTGNASISVNNGSAVSGAVTPQAGLADFFIGNYTAGAFFGGLIDEAAIWSRVLTPDERTELYNSGTGKFFNGTNFVEP